MKYLARVVIAFAAVGGFLVQSDAAKGATSTFVTPAEKIVEARAESQILTGFGLNPQLRYFELWVAVDGGVATLGGTVEDNVSKELAGQIAMQADGVGDVQNRIAVDPRYVPRSRPPGFRSFGEKVDDAAMTAKIKSKLLWSSRTDGLDIHVRALAGRVVLTGNAATADEKASAGRIARNTDGVSFLSNEIVVSEVPRSSTAAPAEQPPVGTSESASDSWVSSKVKSSLMFTRGADIFGIAVSTLDGVVSLKGTVASDAERGLVIEVAEDVRGVKKVDASGLKVGA